MPIDDIINERTDVEALRQQQAQASLRQEMASPRQSRPTASLGSVVQIEKTDIQLWVEVGILVTLVYIAMRL